MAVMLSSDPNAISEKSPETETTSQPKIKKKIKIKKSVGRCLSPVETLEKLRFFSVSVSDSTFPIPP